MARVLLTALVLLVLGLAQGRAEAAAGAGKVRAEAPPAVTTLRTLITGSCQEAQRYAESVLGTGVIRSAAESAVLFLESLLGQENINTMTMFLETVIRFVAEGAASGLNVIAVYVTEILRVTGFDDALTLPRFTPEGVTAVAQWGLLALIGYWVLTIVLRLLIGVMRQVFWVVKTVIALWLFGLIAMDKQASAEVTAVRLGGLVLACVLLTLLTSGSEKSCVVENRLSSLEGRLKAVEKRKGE
ncbi:voltage-gated monoatomic cation channel TMEM109-like isoform X1 [Cololabis saira]|uniref:voltage-gated monoatomic cation channel TMEM109-like isoform X1 n=1 Tax=Cololabis saira TaxID=129043 RepID=UPI002AD4B544|nr:voltage-gated monoatomic cation channel TMEM109-like isoform X1 [Cololabis saira]XP_061581175.1 voltage-gated monoatomic cation channel TMEM109-like isoform X1 [Cololabis saira]